MLDFLGGRLIPSLAMRASKVVGLRPSISAAPPTPRMRQPQSCKTPSICPRMPSSRVMRDERPRELNEDKSTCNESPEVRIKALSMTLLSSRTLPGQE